MNISRSSIFILDLHNTLYDEVLEYGGAISATIDFFIDQGLQQNTFLDRSVICAELATAHAKLQSDWDNDAWVTLPELKKLSNLDKIIREAISIRLSTSESLTRKYAYVDTIYALRTFHALGVKLIVTTEGTANAAADAIRWLELDGIIDAVYSWPFNKTFPALAKTKMKVFPKHPRIRNMYLQKPHALILCSVMLDLAKEDKIFNQDVELADIFDLVIDDSVDVSMLLDMIMDKSNQAAVETVLAIHTASKIKLNRFGEQLSKLRDRCVYIGDSLFKDGYLARNAGVRFIHAFYGKKVLDDVKFQQARDMLYRVSGWDPFLLQLTHEASKLSQLTSKITPEIICTESLRELEPFVDELKP